MRDPHTRTHKQAWRTYIRSFVRTCAHTHARTHTTHACTRGFEKEKRAKNGRSFVAFRPERFTINKLATACARAHKRGDCDCARWKKGVRSDKDANVTFFEPRTHSRTHARAAVCTHTLTQRSPHTHTRARARSRFKRPDARWVKVKEREE